MSKSSRHIAIGGKIYLMIDAQGRIIVPLIHFPDKNPCAYKVTYSVDENGNNGKIYITLDESKPMKEKRFRFHIPAEIRNVLDLTTDDILECRGTDTGFILEFSSLNRLRLGGR